MTTINTQGWLSIFKWSDKNTAERAFFWIAELKDEVWKDVVEKLDRVDIYSEYISLFNGYLRWHLEWEDFESEIIHLLDNHDIYPVLTNPAFIETMYILFGSEKNKHFWIMLYNRIERLWEMFHDQMIYNMLFDAIFVDSHTKNVATMHFLSLFMKRHWIDNAQMSTLIDTFDSEGIVFEFRIDEDDLEKLWKIKRVWLLKLA